MTIESFQLTAPVFPGSRVPASKSPRLEVIKPETEASAVELRVEDLRKNFAVIGDENGCTIVLPNTNPSPL